MISAIFAVFLTAVADDNSAKLRRWSALGLTPGAHVQILDYQELDDLFEVSVAGTVIRLGSEGLSGIRGEAISA